MQIAAKYPECWISSLKILHIFIQYFHRKISLWCTGCHIFIIPNLENYFMKQLLLLSMLDLIIIIRNLPVISFPDIIPFYRFIKQFFVNILQVFIPVTDVQIHSVRINIFCNKIPSVMSKGTRSCHTADCSFHHSIFSPHILSIVPDTAHELYSCPSGRFCYFCQK